MNPFLACRNWCRRHIRNLWVARSIAALTWLAAVSVPSLTTGWWIVVVFAAGLAVFGFVQWALDFRPVPQT